MNFSQEVPIVVTKFDGQCIWIGQEVRYELCNFLGGGASGLVHEAIETKTRKHFAIKILNPVAYRMMTSVQLKRFSVVIQVRAHITFLSFFCWRTLKLPQKPAISSFPHKKLFFFQLVTFFKKKLN